MTLDQIAIRMGTDKSSLTHSYTQHYQQYFEPLRDRKLSLLEIGIQSGASLRMWKSYFSQAEIFGFDYYDCSPIEEERITFIQGNQEDPEDLQKLGNMGSFHIIIDDGSHKNKDALTSFNYLFPRLAPGGIYIIEDLNIMYWGDTHNVGKPTMIERIKGLVDDVQAGGKSGIGDYKKDQQDPEYAARGDGKMTWWEKNVSFLHLYRGMAFIGKYENYY